MLKVRSLFSFCMVFMSLFFIFFLNACSDNKSVVSYTDSIGTMQPIVIKLNVPLTQDSQPLQGDDIGKIYTHTQENDAILLNGKPIVGQYVFKSAYELMIMPFGGADDMKQPLKPNASYTLEVKLKKLQNSALTDTLRLSIKTLPTQIHASKFTPSYLDDGRFSFSVVLNLSQEANLELMRSSSLESNNSDETLSKLLKDSMTLKDSKGKDIDFVFTPERGIRFSIHSVSLEADSEETYTLTLKAKAFGLEEDASFRYVRVKEGMSVVDMQAISSSSPQIQIAFSQNLGDNPNLKDFISIQPSIKKANIVSNGNVVSITAPFSLKQKYEVHVKEGIKGIDGSRMDKSVERELVFNEITPQLVFSENGVFLPSNAQRKIAFKSINVKKVKLKVSKIYPNNITAYLYKHDLVGNINTSTSYDDYDEYDDDSSGGIYADIDRLGDVVFEKTYEIEEVKNQWIQTQLDFSTFKASQSLDVKGVQSEGIYIVELSFDKDGVDYTFPQDTSDWRIDQFFRTKGVIQKHLVFSNIALIAQQIEDSTLEVQALDIVSNKPLAQVQLAAINSKNQVIAQTLTNNDGRAILSIDSQKAMYVSASKGKDTTILRLNAPLSLEGFDTSGIVTKGSVNAYVYADRGVYRPGDDAHINIVARANSKPISHPIFLTLISPRNKIIFENMEIKENLYGLFHHTIHFDKVAETGIWQLKVSVGDTITWHNIPVESVVPNRIKTIINAQDSITPEDLDNGLNYELNANYLFGAPAANLHYESGLSVYGVNFYAPAYKNYVFSNPSSLQYKMSDSSEGSLDENGFMQGNFTLENTENLNKNLRATISAKVYENGGRYVNTYKNVDIMLYPSFVGIKAPNRYVRADSKINVSLIVLDAKSQKPLSGHTLHYKVYQNSYSWWWDYDDYNSFARSIKSDRNTKLISEGETTSQSSPISLEFSTAQSGELFIEVEDVQSGNSSGVYLYASEDGEPSLAPKLTQLKVQSDKPSYGVGEEAVVSFESRAGGKALVSLVNDTRVLKRLELDTKDGTTSFNIPLESAYAPNVYVSIHLLQNYNTLDNDRSQRLFGVLPLMVEDKDSKLTIDIESPKQVRPNDSFDVKLSNKEGKQTAYTLAIVDEGLLDLTDFVSPNPWKYFYQKLALMLSSFDNYDLIIGRNIGKIHQILKVGGDVALGSARKNLKQAERFKPVVLYSAPIKSDESGHANFHFTMPSYIGSVRIMAVAVNERAMGGAESTMKVSAPVVMLPTIPRSLKIGDEFDLAVEVFPTQPKVGKVKLNFASGEKIKLDKKEVTLELNDQKSQIVTLRAKVSDTRMGEDSIRIALESNEFKMEEKTDIDILPNNPYTTISKKFILKAGESLSLENPSNVVQDSQHGYVRVSNKPIMSVDHRLSWLIRYPYGCVEQTTSSVLPQLFLSDLSNANFIDKPEIVKNINTGIARIANFQTSDGGFAYWQGGSKSDIWGSAYAGHFLLLAKAKGYYVPESVLKKWINFEVHYVKSGSSSSIYPLYLLSLAGVPQVGILNDVYEQHFNELAVSEKWLLAAAYKLAGLDEIAQKITTNLPAKSDKRDENYYSFSYGSRLRDDALILQAYYDVHKNVDKKLFNSILQDLESSEWHSTQTLGYSLLALASSAQANGADLSQAEGKFTFSLDKEDYTVDTTLDSTLRIPYTEQRGVLVSKSQSPLFVNQVWDGILLEKNIEQSAQKISLTRRFLDKDGKPIDVKKLPQNSSFYIELILDNADRQVQVNNVAITQNLPSGWEIENIRLNGTEVPDFARGDEVTYMDIRDDSIMWFNDFNGRKQSVFVKIIAITPGTYILPPATAEAMYDHSFRANTQSLPVEVSTRAN